MDVRAIHTINYRVNRTVSITISYSVFRAQNGVYNTPFSNFLFQRSVVLFAMANTFKLTELNMNGVNFNAQLQHEYDETLSNKAHHSSMIGLPLQLRTSTDGGDNSPASMDKPTDAQLAVLGVNRCDLEAGAYDDRPNTPGCTLALARIETILSF